MSLVSALYYGADNSPETSVLDTLKQYKVFEGVWAGLFSSAGTWGTLS